MRTCNQLILELNKNKGKTKPRKSQIVDKKDNTTTGDQQIQVASGGGLQVPFDESDYQWVQLMIDALIADDGSQLFQELHLNQTNQPNPQEHQNIAQHSVPAVSNEQIHASSLPPPHIRSSQPNRNHLVVLSPNDILRLANILQLSPETLTIAIDTLHPISIQAAYVRLLDGLRPSTTSSSSKNRWILLYEIYVFEKKLYI